MRPGPALAIAGAATAAAIVVTWRALHDLDAVVVSGRSMRPTLEPGDRLLVEAWTYRRRPPRVGEIVLATDPRVPRRELIKRVAALDDGALTIRGDGVASTDSRAFGPVAASSVRWRAVLRYWPLHRFGPIT